MELITYLYRGYNPVTKYHGHPSSEVINLIASLLSLRSNSKGSLFLGEELAPETNSSHLKIDAWKIAFLFF